MNVYIWLGIVGTVILLLFFSVLRIRKNSNRKIRINIICDDGNYFAKGAKHRFQIRKNNRYIFEVENGHIVAAKERHGLRYKRIVY